VSPRAAAALAASTLVAILAFDLAAADGGPIGFLVLIGLAGLGVQIGRRSSQSVPPWFVAGLPAAGIALVVVGRSIEDFSGSAGPLYAPLTTAGSIALTVAVIAAGIAVGGAIRTGDAAALRVALFGWLSHVRHERRGLSWGQEAARRLTVFVFVFAGLTCLTAAMIGEGEEAYTTWSSPKVLGLLVFGGANLVAAALSVLPGRSIPMRVLSALSLVPAVPLMNEHAGRGSTSYLLGALTLVVAGGLLAGLGPPKVSRRA
jgi:hypothetical protein